MKTVKAESHASTALVREDQPGRWPSATAPRGAGWLARLVGAFRVRSGDDRRGVVIILALAVLAIIALAALSYMTVVRSDRVSSVVVAERAGYERQHAVVIDQIGALLTADLFGQKIVTADVPKTFPGNSDYPNWPRPFEDGNQWDYPHSDPWFLQGDDAGRILRPTEQQPQNRIAQPSQPWLASTEPLWDLTSNLNNLDRTKVWLQITNLRSGYRWDPTEGNSGAWVRGDGKFADLMQFFLNPVDDGGVLRGNSRVDLLGLNTTPVDDRGQFVEPIGGSFFRGVGAPSLYNLSNPFSDNSRDSTAVWDIPMSEMTRLSGNNDSGPGVLDNADERWWVDTTGDGRPDARWQVVDELGDLGGLFWVAATRVIDASGLLNYNTALEFSYAGLNLADLTSGNKVPETSIDRDPRASVGRTPADVDLFGVIYEMSGGDAVNGPGNIFDTGPGTQNIRMRNDLFTFAGDPNQIGNNGIDAFEDHMYNGLGLKNFFASADRAANVLNAGPGTADPLGTLPSYFDSGAGGFGGNTVWRTRPEGIPSISGLPRIRNYTQVVHPSRGLPDHALSQGETNTGGFTTDTDSNTPQLPTLTDSQRRAFYLLGVLPGDASPLAGLNQYPLSDLIDLRSYWGTNSDGLSQIERRIDGPQGTEGFGDGIAYLPDGNLSGQQVYGPLRSRELSLTARMNQPPDSGPFDLDLVRPNNEQIYHDIRRLLTPHSGAAPFSLMPVLNPAHPAFQTGSLVTKPVVSRPIESSREITDLFNAFVWALAPQVARPSETAPSNQVVPPNWRGENGRLPFSNVIPALAGNPANPAPYYGGGAQELDGLPLNLPGPASRLWANGTGAAFLNRPVGASYALRAALALTVNTISATREQSSFLAPDPTIVRFYPAGEGLPPGELLPADAPGQTVPGTTIHSVAGRFPFGDLPLQFSNQNLLPPVHLGTAESGITAVGLQRQPFLIGGYSLSVYENPLGVPYPGPGGTGARVLIDPSDSRSRLGSIFAIEIGNPWDTQLDLAGYEVQLHTKKIASSEYASAIRIALSAGEGNQVLLPGENRVFAVVCLNQNGPLRTEETMEAIYLNWEDSVFAGVVRIDADDLNRVRIDFPSADALEAENEGNLFNRLTTEKITQVPLLLVRRLSGEFGEPPNRRAEILVDRLLPDFGSTPLGGTINTPGFPAFYEIDGSGQFFEFTKPGIGGSLDPGAIPTQYLFARVTREAEVRRPAQNAMNATQVARFSGGFPAYVIERPSQNVLFSQEFDSVADAAIVEEQFSNFNMVNSADPPLDPDPVEPFYTDDAPNARFSKNEAALRIGNPTDVNNSDDILERETGVLPFAESFELFVPTQGILSKADILRLTAFAHIYRPTGPQGWAVDVSRGNAAFSTFLLDNQPSNPNAGVDAPGIAGNNSEPFWLTVSEQLGMDANLYLGQVGAEVAVNPYFHVLNPLRDYAQAGSDAANTRRADMLTIPPAVRVLDAIEVFETARGVIPGRININTAPDQVLKAIPMMMPRHDIAAWQNAPFLNINTTDSHLRSPLAAGQSGQAFMRAYTDTRIETLTAYRDRYSRSSSPLPSGLNAGQIAEFAGVSDANPFRQPGGRRNNQPRGIISIGEVVNMHRWRAQVSVPNLDGSSAYFQPLSSTDEARRGFAELATNPLGQGRLPNFGPPFEMESMADRPGAVVGSPPISPIFGAPLNTFFGDGFGKPADDVGERLAIFRAMSNIIETRSDVFLATFVIRGYRPSVIDSITVGADNDPEEAAIAMNSERFRPEYESRWLVLFDRSNVRLPTDRPRVLLKAELPPARK